MTDLNQPDLAQLNQEIDDLRRQKQWPAAIAKASQGVEQMRQAVGEAHPGFAAALSTLAHLCAASGDYRQALSLYPWALQIIKKALGPNHPEIAAIRQNLGDLHLAQGNLSLAETQFDQALAVRQVSPAPNHPDLAQTLHSLGQLRLAQGRYDEAESFFNQALSLRQTSLPPNHPDTAQTLHQLGRLAHRQGNYLKALALYQQALTIRQAALAEDQPDLGGSLNDLGQLYHDLGDYAQAEQFYNKALALRPPTTSGQQPAYAADLDRLAGLYHDMGRYDEAEKLYQQALQIRQAAGGDKQPEYAHSVENLARLHYTQGDYEQAKGMQQWAVQLKRKALGQNHPDIAPSLDVLGRIWQAMGQYDQARDCFEQALAIQQAAANLSQTEIATSLDNLAELYRVMGNYAEAGPRYQQALQIRQTVLSQTHPDLVTSLDNLAEFYQAIADYAQAAPLFRQVLEIRRIALGESHPAYAESLHNLATVYAALGDAAGARPLFEQALAIRQAALGREHPLIAQTLTGLADARRALGDYAGAEPLYQQARQIWAKTGGDKHPDFARALHHLAELYHVQGKLDQAKALYQWAYQIRQAALGETHPDVAETLNNLAALYPSLGFIPLALQTVQTAAAINNQLIGLVFSIGSERQRMAYWQTFNQNSDTFLSLVVRHFAHSTEAIRSAFEMILRRKALGAEALVIQRDALFDQGNPTLGGKLAELKTLRQQIAQKTLAGPGAEPLPNHRQTLADWTRQREQLESELAQQIPEMNLTQRLRRVDGPAVAAALPASACLVEWVRFHLYDPHSLPDRGTSPAGYLAFVLTAGAPDAVQMIDLGAAAAIDPMIAAFRDSITGEAKRRTLVYGYEVEPGEAPDSNIGLKLRAALFDPLLPALGDCRRLFLSPDGDLSRLPFEVLPTEAGRRLIDDYQISYLGVGRDVLRFGAEHTGQPAEPVVVADPNFDLVSSQKETVSSQKEVEGQGAPEGGQQSKDLDRAGVRFGRLPGTRQEGEQIAGMLGVSPMLADAALEQKLKAARSPRILHIATHGFFLPDQKPAPNKEQSASSSPAAEGSWGRLSYALENPLLRSGLALAGVNTWLKNGSLPPEAEDGILTAEDVTGLDLLATELAVLSACETGLGEVQVGEGVFGLRRAFVLAGVKTLVMSLWKVPDQQTQELMIDFYRRILAGEPRAEALRQAQLVLQEKYPNPLYWGAFICQGEPGRLLGDDRQKSG